MPKALNMIYFDHAATSPITSEVAKTYIQLLSTQFANSESSYDLGVQVSQNLEKSRALTARLLNVKTTDIIFTSGASESNNMALKGLAFAYQDKGKHIISTNTEHSSVLATLKQLETLFGFKVTYLPVNSQGSITLQQVQSAMTPETILVSVMAINNEVGSINPVEDIARYCFKQKVLCHVDAVQALAKHTLDYSLFDAVSLSAHKIGGLKGSGVCILKEHLAFEPLIAAGSQEFKKRGGTSNALVHTMFAKTLKLALEANKNSVQSLNDYLRRELSHIPQVKIHTPLEGSVYFLSFSVLGFTSEMLANALNQKGIYVSYRSTCHNRDAKGSTVLKAMGKSEAELVSVLRLSFNPKNILEEGRIFIDSLKGVIDQYGTR